jgi:hypothetical protein
VSHFLLFLRWGASAAAILQAQTTPPVENKAATYTLDAKLVPLHIRVLDKKGKMGDGSTGTACSGTAHLGRNNTRPCKPCCEPLYEPDNRVVPRPYRRPPVERRVLFSPRRFDSLL